MKTPWGNLTKYECDAMNALIKKGCNKLASRELGCDQRQIENATQRVRKKMGGCHRLQAVVFWDRFVRGSTYVEVTRDDT